MVVLRVLPTLGAMDRRASASSRTTSGAVAPLGAVGARMLSRAHQASVGSDAPVTEPPSALAPRRPSVDAAAWWCDRGASVFDARDVLRSFAPEVQPPPPTRLLRWTTAMDGDRGEGLRIALLDGGVDPGHPDLRDADIERIDLLDSAPDDHDTLHHGTRDACLLVGRGRLRIRGLTPAATLLHARVIAADVGPPSALAAGLAWARQRGAGVIIMPIGGDTAALEVEAELDRCAAAGIRLLAAAGNGNPAPVEFPARHPAVIAVGAVDPRGWLIPASARHPRLDLLAPAGDVPALDRSEARARGTSIACVLAGGAAALDDPSIRSHDPMNMSDKTPGA